MDVQILPTLDPLDLPFDPTEEGELAEQYTLNLEQKVAARKILQACLDTNSSNSHVFYLCGPGGSGKTYLYNTI